MTLLEDLYDYDTSKSKRPSTPPAGVVNQQVLLKLLRMASHIEHKEGEARKAQEEKEAQAREEAVRVENVEREERLREWLELSKRLKDSNSTRRRE